MLPGFRGVQEMTWHGRAHALPLIAGILGHDLAQNDVPVP
jgi:hypothetical protein